MRMVDIIVKKRDQQELSQPEIDYFIQGFASGDIPDYQASALLMAMQLNGMSPQETADMTLSIVASGETNDLSGVVAIAVDKHSTGGVGDKTTLMVEPIVAACGLPVGKVSGRGLGFSGGTLDKMESVPGYRVDLNREEFLTQLKEIGLVLTGQTGALAPADGKLYALRDVTGTVPSISLIASSIMSKKIAGGAQRIVLDVKVGKGAFMETLEDARELAETMVKIGELAKRKTVALLSDMNQPLGVAVGNALEVREAIDALRGGGPKDFREHAYKVASQLLILGDRARDEAEARELAESAVWSGKAWEMFRKLVIAQSGDVSYVDDPQKLPTAALIEHVPAPKSGFIAEIDARVVGESAVVLGAGRAAKGEPIDHAVGFEILHNVGDEIQEGEALFIIHANRQDLLDNARDELLRAHVIQRDVAKPLPLFYGLVQ